jgi:hypothetical protein
MEKLKTDSSEVPPPLEEFVLVSRLHADTERMLWRQRLDQMSDAYVHDAQNHVQGVPKFAKADRLRPHYQIPRAGILHRPISLETNGYKLCKK